MSAAQWHRKIISGEGGVLGPPVRAALGAIEPIYAAVMRRRNARFDRGDGVSRCTVPVISVGNVTVGGTGKTPLVIELVSRLERLGRRVGVLARGYKSSAGQANDEERVIRDHCPGVAYIADPDRVRGAELLRKRDRVDVVVLDDGFQHRRLARDLDIVLVDVTCPFGFDRLLPRGLLREPPTALRRAGLIVVTRANAVPERELTRLMRKLREHSGQAPIIRCRHEVTAVERLDGAIVSDSASALKAFLVAGIGQPAAFQATVESLNFPVVGCDWLPDHHNYTARDLSRIMSNPLVRQGALVLTTEKDAAKLAPLAGDYAGSIAVVKIAIAFVDDDASMLDAILQKTLG